MSRRKLAIGIILIVGLLVNAVALGADLDFQVDRSEDDSFGTEVGGSFVTAPYVAIKDPNYQTVSNFLFRNIAIYNSRIINNATLSVHTTSNQAADLSALATIYGLEVGSGGLLDRISLTTAFTNWNISQVRGIGTWHNVTVTNIVQELIDRYGWDYGDNLAFEILSTSGALRQVVAYDYGNPTLAARLYLSYGEAPPDPPGLPPGAEYNQTVEGYDIYRIPVYDDIPPEYVFWRQGGALPTSLYDTVHTQPSERISIAEVTDTESLYSGGQRQITRVENGTIYVVYESRGGTATDRIWVKNSSDEGVTWSVAKELSILAGFTGSYEPRIAVDSNNTLHVVWRGLNATNRNIWYVNNTASWTKPIGIITSGNMTLYPSYFPAIAVDEWDNLHVVWAGNNLTFPAPNQQIFYANRTTGWSPPVRINTAPTMEQRSVFPSYASITCDSNNVTHVSFRATTTDYNPGNFQIWHTYTYSNGSWSIPIRVSRYADMSLNPQDKPSLAIGYANNTAHLVWNGKAQGFGSLHIWYAEYNGSWSWPIPLSNYPGMTGQHQFEATIAVYPDDTIHVLWSGKATGYTNDYCIWDRQYNTSWGAVRLLQNELTRDLTAPNLAYSRFPERIDETWQGWSCDNGNCTVLECDTLDCLIDLITGTNPDPQDPEPSPWKDSPALLGRFSMRRYFLMIGWGMFWGPIWFFCYRRPSGYLIGAAFIFMLIGLGLLLQIPYV